MRHLARVLALSLLALPCLALAQNAATVLVNGKIVSVDGKESIHQAMAIREDRIVAVGKTGAIRSLAGKHTRVIDLDGRTVIPGLMIAGRYIPAYPGDPCAKLARIGAPIVCAGTRASIGSWRYFLRARRLRI